MPNHKANPKEVFKKEKKRIIVEFIAHLRVTGKGIRGVSMKANKLNAI